MAEEQVADAPVVETGEAPSDWKASLPEDIQNNSLIHNIDSVEGLAKTAIHAQSMVGAEKIAIPGNWANDDDWNGVYTKLGRPEESNGYDLKNPEGVDNVDKDVKGWYQELAHDAGLNNRQAQKIYDAYLAKSAEMAPENTELSEEQREIQKGETELTLKKEWGKAFDDKLDAAKSKTKELIALVAMISFMIIFYQQKANRVLDPLKKLLSKLDFILEKIAKLKAFIYSLYLSFTEGCSNLENSSNDSSIDGLPDPNGPTELQQYLDLLKDQYEDVYNTLLAANNQKAIERIFALKENLEEDYNISFKVINP